MPKFGSILKNVVLTVTMELFMILTGVPSHSFDSANYPVGNILACISQTGVVVSIVQLKINKKQI